MSQYYVCKPGENAHGPVSEEMLRQGMRDGSYPAESKAWKDGMDCWLTLAELFGTPSAVSAAAPTQSVVIPVPATQPAAVLQSVEIAQPVKKRRRKKKTLRVPVINDEEKAGVGRANARGGIPIWVGVSVLLLGVLLLSTPEVLNKLFCFW